MFHTRHPGRPSLRSGKKRHILDHDDIYCQFLPILTIRYPIAQTRMPKLLHPGLNPERSIDGRQQLAGVRIPETTCRLRL